MVIDRRQFLTFVSALAGCGLLPLAGRAESRQPLYAAARREADGSYSACLFTKDQDLLEVPLPGRGHDLAVRPGGRELVVFARRPGSFAIAFSTDGKEAPFSFQAPKGRHFYGHGVFSKNGRLLYCSENDYETGRGIIGVYDASSGYQRVGEFSSHGIGPHDLALMPDGRSLVVANGGLETHPEHGRQILNLAEMVPSLCYIDINSGDLLEKALLPQHLHQLSIRHLAVGNLAVSTGARVVFGCQYKGPAGDQPQLMAFHDRGAEIKTMAAPDALLFKLKNYIGSVAVDQQGEVVAASAPRGNLITYWRLVDGAFLGTRPLADGCGVAAGAGAHEFLLTSGHGAIHGDEVLPADGRLRERFAAKRQASFDNHAVYVGEI